MESEQIDKRRLQRIKKLVLSSHKLSHAAIAAIVTLEEQTCLSANDLWLLEQIEQRFQVNNNESISRNS